LIGQIFNYENGMYDFLSNDFVNKLKKLNYISIEEDNLDTLALKHYTDLNMWWVIALYNDIINPFEVNVVKIPDMISVKTLIKDYIIKNQKGK